MWQSTRRGRTAASTAVCALFLSLSRVPVSALSDQLLAVARCPSLALTVVLDEDLEWIRLLKIPAAGFPFSPRRMRSGTGWGG